MQQNMDILSKLELNFILDQTHKSSYNIAK